MSGKFLICFAIINLAFISGAVYPQTDYPQKDKLVVNGFSLDSYGKNELIGLRSKALADLKFRKEQYNEAIKYYEDASKYLPNEADIYLSLGNIYAFEKVYRMAAKYYKIAMGKYLLPENFGKTQKYYYLAQIRYAYYLDKLGNDEDNHKIAEGVFQKLLNVQNEMQSKYPDTAVEMDYLRRQIYGDVKIIQRK